MNSYGPRRVGIRVLCTIFKVVPLAGLFIIFGVICQGISVGVIFWLTKQTLDSTMKFANHQLTFWNGPGYWLILFIVIPTINSVLIQLRIYASSYAEKRIKVSLQEQIYQKVTDIPFHSIEDSKFRDDLQRANFALNLFLIVFLTMFTIIQIVIGLITLISIFTAYSWWLLITLIIISIPALINRMYFSKKIFEVEHSKVQAKRQADYLKSLLIQRQLAKEIRLFNIGGYLIDRWFKTTQSYTKGYLKTAWKRENSTFTIQVITSIFYIVCITIISSSAIRETLTIGIFVALIQAVQKFQQSLETLSTQMAFYIQHSNHVGAAYQFIERVIPETKQTSTLTDTLFSIEFKHVSFRYPGAHDDSLKDLSFVINEGERVALLGENGAGKSTIAKLILGLYKPTKGKIYINGQDIESVNIQEMRNRITAVFQDFVRYQLRFRENIGFGEIYCIHDDNKLYDAASKVDMDAFIRSTSKAIDSQLGNQFTHGIDLSGGQWQRLAMARSYLRNAAFIMMDEPTAALDPIAEVEVYKQFMKIADIKTTLFISHRVGLARLADRIFILKDGRLIEEGHHERLIKAGGEYAEFFKTQAKWYEDVPTG